MFKDRNDKSLLDGLVNPVYVACTISIYFSRMTVTIMLRLPN